MWQLVGRKIVEDIHVSSAHTLGEHIHIIHIRNMTE